MILTKLLLAYSCGLVDRVRGDGATDALYSKGIEQVIYGLFVAVLVGLTVWWQVLLFAGLWAMGASFGWGTPLSALLHNKPMRGPKYEWWQTGRLLKTNALFACFVRGFIWGLCVAPMAYFVPAVGLFPLIMAIIFPSAILLAKHTKCITEIDWARQEFYRGWMVGMSALLLGYLI